MIIRLFVMVLCPYGSDVYTTELPERRPEAQEKPAGRQPPVETPADQSRDEPIYDLPVQHEVEEMPAKKMEEGSFHEVETLLKHKVSDDGSGRIIFLIKWVDDAELTWEPEEAIQDGASESLFEYWKKRGGRDAALFQGPKPLLKEQYWVYKILQHKKTKATFHFQVQWVGYPADDASTTWEPETKLKKTANEILEDY